MKLDPVLAEIRAVREAYAEKFAGDIKGMLADLRKRQEQGGRKATSRPPKTVLGSQVSAHKSVDAPTLGQVRQELSQVPGSWADEIIADRGEY